MPMKLKSSSKREVGVFSRVVIFPSKICPLHTVSLPLLMHVVIPRCFFTTITLHVSAHAITANGVYFHLLVPCTVLLLWCCLHMYYGINSLVYFQEKSTLCNNFFKKEDGLIFEGGPISPHVS